MGVLPTGLGVFVCTMIWTKFILATSRRALYPFAPEVGRATGVSEQSVASVLAVMQGCYCLVPLLTPWLARRVGTDHILVGAVALVALAQLAGAFSQQNFAAFAVVVACFGVGKGLFDPTLQLRIRMFVPEEQRGTGASTARTRGPYRATALVIMF